MNTIINPILKWKLIKNHVCRISIAALSLTVVMVASTTVRADAEDAKKLLKGMSDYLASQNALSFEYDAILEVVTKEEQKLALVASGSVALKRPDKIHTTRSGGFADVDVSFDGKTLTVLGKSMNIYSQVDVPGTVDHLVDELRNKYNRPLPAADLLLSNSYELLMLDVVDIKDLGSGVVGGVECDYFAFRKKDIDWQIWIAQGERPYPCRYSITSKLITGGPQYTIQTRNWKTGDEVAADFSFKNKTQASKIEMKDLKDTGDFPEHFKMGATK